MYQHILLAFNYLDSSVTYGVFLDMHCNLETIEQFEKQEVQ